MTGLNSTGELVAPTDAEVNEAIECGRTLAAHIGSPNKGLRVQVRNGKGDAEMTLPSSAVKLLVNILAELGQGKAVALATLPSAMTTDQAAELLDMPHAQLVTLLDDGVIPSQSNQQQRTVHRTDVLNYLGELRTKRLAALDELTSLSQKLGMGY